MSRKCNEKPQKEMKSRQEKIMPAWPAVTCSVFFIWRLSGGILSDDRQILKETLIFPLNRYLADSIELLHFSIHHNEESYTTKRFH